MKRLLLSLVFVFVALSASLACPICGCGVGGFYIGLLPTYNGKFVGVRYQYSRYETHLKGDPTQYSHDYYKIAELYGGISLGTRWQLLGFIPYHFNYQNTDDGIVKRNGMGDASVLVNYNVLQKVHVNDNMKTNSQELWLGAGIKLPTGKYAVNFKDSVSRELEQLLGDVNSQMGTGSTDFILNAMYNVHLARFGVNTTLNYKMNTSNSSNFRYGARFTASSIAYYQAALGKTVNVEPNAGLSYEHIASNYLKTSKVDQTGGYAAMASAGVELNIRKITVGTNIELPVTQDYALGQTQYKARGLVHVTYSF